MIACLANTHRERERERERVMHTHMRASDLYGAVYLFQSFTKQTLSRVRRKQMFLVKTSDLSETHMLQTSVLSENTYAHTVYE